MKKAKTEYVATWAEYNHNNMGSGGLVCGLLGVFPSMEKARYAIDCCILEDVEHELQSYEGLELPEEYEGKTPEQIAKEWTYVDNEDEVCVWCGNGIECAYSICEVNK